MAFFSRAPGALSTAAAEARKKAGLPPVTAPGPVATPALAPPTPPDATRARSEAQALALTAAKKQRKRATSAGTLLTGGAPGATATLTPRTLVGYVLLLAFLFQRGL